MTDKLSKITTRQKIIIILAFITIVAAVLRINFYFHIKNRLIINGDALNYHYMAKQLVHHRIYGYTIGSESGKSNASVPPVFPLLFSAVCALIKNSGGQINAMRIIQVILSTFTPLLSYLSLNLIFKQKNIALLTAFLVAIYPPYYQSPYRVLTEVTALFSMVLYFYLSALSFTRQKTYLYFLSGGAFAIQILTRPAMLPLFVLPFIYGFFATYKGNFKALSKAFVFTLCGFIIVMLPWWIRNVLTLHHIVLTSDGSANPFLAGTYPEFKGMSKDLKNCKIIHFDQESYAIHRIVNGFSHHPLVYLKWYTAGKLKFLFSTPWMLEEIPSIRIYNIFIHYFIIISGVFGIIMGIAKNQLARFISLYCMGFIGIYLIFIPTSRYSYQLMFTLMSIGSYFLCTFYDFLSNKIRKTMKNDDLQAN